MKATDLMIGDWYYWEAEGGMYTYKVIAEDFVKGEIPNFYPIPLTQEIMEKNGFEKKEDDYGQELYSLLLGEWVITFMSIHGCPYLTIEDVLDYDRGHSVLNLKDSVYNVHELQHALKLCGIDKEIKL